MLLNILSPPSCYSCRNFLTSRDIFCAVCTRQVQPVVSVILPITSSKSIKVFAACAYQDPVRRLILAKGWSNSAASRQLAQLIWHKTYIDKTSFDYLIPIPLHWRRYAHRGFNQAYIMAQELAYLSGKELLPVLKRIRATPFQSCVAGKERAANVANAFAIKQYLVKDLKNKHILLVDDLMTTGATLRSAAKKLYELRPASITAVVASRVVQS